MDQHRSLFLFMRRLECVRQSLPQHILTHSSLASKQKVLSKVFLNFLSHIFSSFSFLWKEWHYVTLLFPSHIQNIHVQGLGFVASPCILARISKRQVDPALLS